MGISSLPKDTLGIAWVSLVFATMFLKGEVTVSEHFRFVRVSGMLYRCVPP